MINSLTPMDDLTFGQGIAQFNQQDFYACHDTLEAIWMEAIPEEKNFYQGILQIAVGCYHLGNHNWNGAVILLGEGVHRLRIYQPDHHGINVALLVQESYRLLQQLQQIEPTQIDVFLNSQKSNSRDLWPQILSQS